MGGNKIKKLWNGVILFSIFTSLLVLLAQVLIFVLILSVNMSLAFTLFSIFFIIDAIVLITFTKKNIESDIMNISFFVLVLSSPLVYGLIYYLKTFYLPANPQVVHIGSIDSWIGFAGSILSGLLVMISLVYTIKHERLIRDEDKKNELLPFIAVDVKGYINRDTLQNNTLVINREWLFFVNNISNNPARDIKITEISAVFYNIDNEEVFEVIEVHTKFKNMLDTSVIVQNKEHNAFFHINKSNLPTNYYNGLKLIFKIEYSDITLKNKHHHIATFVYKNTQLEKSFKDNGYTTWNRTFDSNEFVD